jgi:hypothetical protein
MYHYRYSTRPCRAEWPSFRFFPFLRKPQTQLLLLYLLFLALARKMMKTNLGDGRAASA